MRVLSAMLRAFTFGTALITFAAGAAVADTIDQSFLPPITGALTVGIPALAVQTFTAGGNGVLRMVSLCLDVSGGPVQLSINSVSGGLPTTNVLSAILVQPGTYQTNQFFNLSAGVTVQKDQQYAIVITYLPGASFDWFGSDNQVYAGGSALLISVGDPNAVWVPVGAVTSFAFRTAGVSSGPPDGWTGEQVPAVETPEPESLVLCGSGLVVLVLMARKQVH